MPAETTLDDESLLLTYDQVAKMLNVSHRTVWSLVDEGQLPKVPVRRRVRIDRRDVLAYISRMKESTHGKHQH